MRSLLTVLAMLLLQGSFDRTQEVDAAPQLFRFQRELTLPGQVKGQACAVLDAAVFELAEGRTGALRVYRMAQPDAAFEVPFAFTESGEAGQETETARAINVGRKGGAIAFDLVMPSRAYTAVDLGLSGHDFYATAKVSGTDGRGGPATELGTFALFDLAGRGLARSTTLPLQEVSFAQLHVELTVTPAPGGNASSLGPEMVGDAKVPPSREAQTLYTTVAESTAFLQQGKWTVAKMHVAPHVPIERVLFTIDPAFKRDFLRAVSVTATPDGAPGIGAVEAVDGEIERVEQTGGAPGIGAIHSERLSVDALMASNLQAAATVSVAVNNGDDKPLPLAQVMLEMRERKVCFEAEQGARYVLRYGAAEAVRAPVYDYARLFRGDAGAASAKMEAETPNPAYRVEVRQTSYMERHPEVLWVALLAVIAVLGTVAMQSAKRAGSSR